MRRLFFLAVGIPLMLLAGCGGPREATEDDRPDPPREEGLTLAASSEDIRTIQLYRTGDETRLPILSLRGGATLTLAFDLMGDRGRPLSVYFYHADRTWRRDLSPAEYLSSFQRGDLFDYRPSRLTEVDYFHYTYEFPNRDIGFEISGNFILRVTEQGMEEDVLFERPFFVTEQSATLDLALDNIILGGTGYPGIQPTAFFTPPADIQANVFDYNVCFVRNGQIDRARCADRPSLASQPGLEFYLEPRASFAPEIADYFVNLGEVRLGGRIEQVDRSTTPFEVFLEPDYARFAGTDLDPLLNGQIVVKEAARSVPEPSVSAEYVTVHFAYVPIDEQPVRGQVLLVGSFNDWRAETGSPLVWVPSERRYEGTVLLKQGQYEYRYLVQDGRTRRALSAAAPRFQNLYTAFVYYNDIRLQTDRLLSVGGVRSQ